MKRAAKAVKYAARQIGLSKYILILYFSNLLQTVFLSECRGFLLKSEVYMKEMKGDFTS